MHLDNILKWRIHTICISHFTECMLCSMKPIKCIVRVQHIWVIYSVAAFAQPQKYYNICGAIGENKLHTFKWFSGFASAHSHSFIRIKFKYMHVKMYIVYLINAIWRLNTCKDVTKSIITRILEITIPMNAGFVFDWK